MSKTNLFIAIVRTSSPALVGGVLGHKSVWAWLPIIPALLVVFAMHRPYTGLAVVIVLEMIVLRAYGLAALLFLLALWLIWQPGTFYHLGAAATLAATGWLTGKPIAWVGAASVLVVMAVFAWPLTRKATRQAYTKVCEILLVIFQTKKGGSMLQRIKALAIRSKELVRSGDKAARSGDEIARSGGEAAQAVTELAIALPVLLLIVLGILEFGRVFVQLQGLDYASDHVAQAAARLGGYSPTLDTVLQNNRVPLLDPALVTFDVNTTDPDGAPICTTGQCTCEYGEIVRVTARYPTYIRILLIYQDLELKIDKSLFCWRGGAP